MHVPQGFAVVTPYIFVDGADQYVRFLQAASAPARLAGASIRMGGSLIVK
ncbi:hypothetical protein [Bradyrhizobium neotropicale]|nr:hypothetical protein [Bradyrhizobium neotropicale]